MLTTVHLAEQPIEGGTILIHDLYGCVATLKRDKQADQWELTWENDNLGWGKRTGQAELSLKILAYAYCVELSACGY